MYVNASGTQAEYTTEQCIQVCSYSLRVLNIICVYFNNSNETNQNTMSSCFQKEALYPKTI